jgi:hypothetical protein
MLIDGLDPDPSRVEWNPVDPDKMLVQIPAQSINEDLFVYTISTGTMTNITNTPDDWEYGTWSPDGNSIGFAGSPIPADGTSLTGFYRIDPDGTNRELLYTPAQGVTATNPAWSPDGMEIAGFCNFRSICVVNPAGGLLREMEEDVEDYYYLGADMDWGFTSGPILGDFDCDGDADLDDALLALGDIASLAGNPCLGLTSAVLINGFPTDFGDVNCNGTFGIDDALTIFLATANIAADGCGSPVGSIANIVID